MTSVNLPPYSSSSFSTAGMSARHGTQRGPQKSTSTLPDATSAGNGLTVASTAIHTSRITETASHIWVMRPRNRLPFAISIVERQLAAREAVQGMRDPGHRRGDVALGRREAGQAATTTEVVHLVAAQLAARHGERREQPVVALRHVVAAGRLGDLRVVQLRRVDVDVGDLAPQLVERHADDLLEQRLLRGVAADTVLADGVEPQSGGVSRRPARRGPPCRRARPRARARRGRDCP